MTATGKRKLVLLLIAEAEMLSWIKVIKEELANIKAEPCHGCTIIEFSVSLPRSNNNHLDIYRGLQICTRPSRYQVFTFDNTKKQIST